MMEHIVHLLNNTLDSILHSRQHGFRRGLSCETQLCSTYHDIVKLTESSSAVHAVVLDFRKAFDKVPHRRLVDKLKSLPNVVPRLYKLQHQSLCRWYEQTSFKPILPFSMNGLALTRFQYRQMWSDSLQQQKKFATFLQDRCANKVLECIKNALNDASQPAKPPAYYSPCRPILKHADVLWNPADTASTQELEAVQNRAIRFVRSIKRRHGITESQTALGLQKLKDRRKSHRFALKTKILKEDEKHAILSSAYSETVNGRN